MSRGLLYRECVGWIRRSTESAGNVPWMVERQEAQRRRVTCPCNGRLKPEQTRGWFLGGRKGAWLQKNILHFTDIFTALKHFVNLQ